MRTAVLIAVILPLVGCSTTSDQTVPFAMPNSLMRTEIKARIANIEFQHGQELLNNLLWLQTKAGETAIVDLMAVLDHDNPKVRSSAVWVLGRIRDRRTIPNLRPLAADTNDSVRFEAARSLVSMGDLKHVTILIEGLDSGKTPVRYNCHMALKDGTSKDFEYDHLEEDITMRRTSVLRWREWWAKQSSDPWFAASYAREHGLPSAMLEQVSAPMGETKVPGKGTETPDSSGQDTSPKTGQPEVNRTPDPKAAEKTEKTEPETKSDKPVFKLLDLGPKTDTTGKTDTTEKTGNTEKQPQTGAKGTGIGTRKVGADEPGPFDVTPTKDETSTEKTTEKSTTEESTSEKKDPTTEKTERVNEVESPVFKLLQKGGKTGTETTNPPKTEPKTETGEGDSTDTKR